MTAPLLWIVPSRGRPANVERTFYEPKVRLEDAIAEALR